MNFYGLLTLQKTNFELASKWFVTVKQKQHPIGCCFCLVRTGGSFEPPVRLVTLQKYRAVRRRIFGEVELMQGAKRVAIHPAIAIKETACGEPFRAPPAAVDKTTERTASAVHRADVGIRPYGFHQAFICALCRLGGFFLTV